MTEYIAKRVMKNVVNDHRPNKRGAEDLYYEFSPVRDRHGRETGKTKKRERQPPPGLDDDEKMLLTSVMHRARRLDNSFSICGVRVGWSAIVGFIPFIGDFFDTLMALWVYRTCQRAMHQQKGKKNHSNGTDEEMGKTEEQIAWEKKEERERLKIESRMMFNITVDFFIGLVPFLGDIGDALWRANTMNAALLYNFMEKRGARRIALRRMRDPSQGRSPNAAPAIVHQHRPNGNTPVSQDAEIARPAPARTKTGNLLDRFNPFAGHQKSVDPERADRR